MTEALELGCARFRFSSSIDGGPVSGGPSPAGAGNETWIGLLEADLSARVLEGDAVDNYIADTNRKSNSASELESAPSALIYVRRTPRLGG